MLDNQMSSHCARDHGGKSSNHLQRMSFNTGYHTFELKSMNAPVKHQHSCQLTSFKSLSVAQGKVMQTFKLKSGSTSIFIHGSNRHCLLKRYVLSSWRSLSWFVNINCHPNKQHKKSNTDPYCQI